MGAAQDDGVCRRPLGVGQGVSVFHSQQHQLRPSLSRVDFCDLFVFLMFLGSSFLLCQRLPTNANNDLCL